MADFFPGQKVMCVRGFPQRPPLIAVPEVGREYVIRAVSQERISTYLAGVKMWGIRLHWLINPPAVTVEGVMEQYFCIHGLDGLPNFRPIVERKTDISIFESLLLRKDVRAPEKV